LSHTRDIIFLGDEEIAVITPSGVTFTDYAGGRFPGRARASPGIRSWRKAGYKHFMLKEIFEQPGP
jgi:glucosamine--fructose-6-phosphate aminotransferase (isomerizing)